jgi:hypothetical protein
MPLLKPNIVHLIFRIVVYSFKHLLGAFLRKSITFMTLKCSCHFKTFTAAKKSTNSMPLISHAHGPKYPIKLYNTLLHILTFVSSPIIVYEFWEVYKKPGYLSRYSEESMGKNFCLMQLPHKLRAAPPPRTSYQRIIRGYLYFHGDKTDLYLHPTYLFIVWCYVSTRRTSSVEYTASVWVSQSPFSHLSIGRKVCFFISSLFVCCITTPAEVNGQKETCHQFAPLPS